MLAYAFQGAKAIPAALGLLLCYVAFRAIHVYWRLRDIPGPIWARWTNLQRVYWVKTRQAHRIHHEMHERYGDVVRFGPSMVSLADPAWIPLVYPMRPGFPKVLFVPTPV